MAGLDTDDRAAAHKHAGFGGEGTTAGERNEAKQDHADDQHPDTSPSRGSVLHVTASSPSVFGYTSLIETNEGGGWLAPISVDQASDSDLMRRTQGGDAEAFGLLYERHRPTVTAICRRLLGDLDAAEEGVQEVFARALDAAVTWEPHARVDHWLHRIARNLCLDVLRARARQAETFLEEIPPLADPRATAGFDQSDSRATVIRLLRRLTDRQRHALLAHDGYGVPLRELAVQLDMTERSLAVALHRARARVRQLTGSPLVVVWPLVAFVRVMRWWGRRLGATSLPSAMGVAAVAFVVGLGLTIPELPTAPQSASALGLRAPETSTSNLTADAKHTDGGRESQKKDRQANRRPGQSRAQSGRDATPKPAPYVDIEPVGVPIVDRQIGTRLPAGDPDYDYGVHPQRDSEELSVTVESYDEPELEAAHSTACDAARKTPVTYCRTGNAD